jgi:hypothetical protein
MSILGRVCFLLSEKGGESASRRTHIGAFWPDANAKPSGRA